MPAVKVKTQVIPAGPIPKEALDFFKAKELKPRFSYLQVWKEEHSLAFTVAKVMEADILESVQKSLARSLETGTTFDAWKQEILPVLEKSGWYSASSKQIPHRLTTIYGTNMRMARSAGQWERVERTMKTRPYLMYALGPSENHRPHHVAWSGTILPADDKWWDTHLPSLGWHCRCHVIQLSKTQADRYGGVTSAPPSNKVPWKNPLTGKSELVTEGVDPGFDYHKGKHRAKGVANAVKAQKQEDIP